MQKEQKIKVFSILGEKIRFILNSMSTKNEEFESIVLETTQNNPWFTKKFIIHALKYWGDVLSENNLTDWLNKYDLSKISSETIGLILAGNIPMVGFHDVLCCLITHQKMSIKLSEKDKVLIPYILKLLVEIDPEYKNLIEYVDKISRTSKIIATGSDNTSRYFEYYFKEKPSIIRKNRTSIAILDGNEDKEELNHLADDIFLYFGLGCRNISKLYLPENYNLDNLYEAFQKYAGLLDHKKYFNNYKYYQTIYLLNQEKILDLGVCTLRPSESLHSPISVLNIEYYKEQEPNIIIEKNQLQCIVGHKYQPFGTSQKPKLNDYADNIDVIDFLIQ